MAATLTTEQQQFTLHIEVSIMTAVDNEWTESNTTKDSGINMSTLLTFLKASEKLQRQYSENTRDAPSQKRIRAADFDDIDKSACKQFLEVRLQDIHVSGPMLRAKASQRLGRDVQDDSRLASAFHSRHNIVFKGSGEEENRISHRDGKSEKCWRPSRNMI